MTDVAKYLLLEAYLFLLRVLMLYPFNLASPHYPDLLYLHLLCVEPDIHLHLAVCVLLSEPRECLLDLLLWLNLENVCGLPTCPPLPLEKVEFEEHLALDEVIVLTEVPLALNALLLLLLRPLSHILILLLREGGRFHQWGLGSGVRVERCLLGVLLVIHSELSKVLDRGGEWCFHNVWGNNLRWLVINC